MLFGQTVSFFFLLEYLANLISKGNKGKGKVEGGGMKF